MIHEHSTIDPQEVSKFSALAAQWWDPEGPFKTLHRLTPLRLSLLQEYGSLTSETILDVGCGGGIFSEAMAREGAIVTGIDAAESTIKIAQQHASPELSLIYQATPIEQLAATMFDKIVCFEMLEHVTSPEQVLRECAARLKPGGLLFLSTIHRTMQAYFSTILMAEYVLGWLPRQTHDYAKFIYPSELAAMARRAGLSVLEVRGMGYDPLQHRAYFRKSVQVNYFMVCGHSKTE